MKFILTGSTGFIGREVLHQCLVNPSITSVVALSRRNLPEASSQNPKLSVVILDDFTTYTEKVLQELSGAAACIWHIPWVQYSRGVQLFANVQIILGAWEVSPASSPTSKLREKSALTTPSLLRTLLSSP